MANSTTTNPIYLDTFSADISISTESLTVKTITLWADDSETRLSLEDVDGVSCVVMGRGTNGPQVVEFGDEGFIFKKGLICDVSDGEKLDGHARVCIYLK